MGIKENWQKKIEKNAFKSTLSYTDKKGAVHTENVIFKRSTAPLGDWTRIYPPIDENGRINKINLWFGGWRNLVKTLLIMILVLLVLMQFKENFATIDYWKNLAEICNNTLNIGY